MAQGKRRGIKRTPILLAGCFAVAVVLFLTLLFSLQKVFQTDTYYVLGNLSGNSNISASDVAAGIVPAKTQITAAMLTPITTSKGSVPPTAIGIAQVQAGNVYTKFQLSKGDVLTASNTGGQADIALGIPDTWVITTFSVEADNAVGGRITRGTYCDMMVAQADGSFYPFVNIFVLDTTVNLSGASSSNAVNTSEAHSGQTTQYVVGLSPQDAARMQTVMAKYSGNIKLVLSPRQNEYNPPQIASYAGMFTFDPAVNTPENLGKGTSESFKDVQRNQCGVPLTNQSADVANGNAQLDPSECSNSKTSASASAGGASPTASASGTNG